MPFTRPVPRARKGTTKTRTWEMVPSGFGPNNQPPSQRSSERARLIEKSHSDDIDADTGYKTMKHVRISHYYAMTWGDVYELGEWLMTIADAER